MNTFSIATSSGRYSLDDRAEAVEQQLQPQREILGVQQHQRRVEDVGHAPGRVAVDDAHAGALRARVDAEDARHVGAASAAACRRHW